MRRFIVGLLSVALFAAIGCEPRDPLERMVKAGTPAAFTSWRSHATSDASADTRRRIEDALQEIRLNVAAEREIKRANGEKVDTSAESIDEAVRDRINARPLREVVQLGYELRVFRLTRELAALQQAMAMNAQLVTKPGDVASRQHLDGLRDRQMGRVDKYQADIAAAEHELVPLQKTTGHRIFEPPTDTPDEMPHRMKAVLPQRGADHLPGQNP
jgi:hypothetical protein